MPISRRFVALSFILSALVSSASAAEPHWIRVASDHFLVLTDGDATQGREVAVRFEQMRAVFGQLLARNRVNLPLPIDIIALKSDDEYGSDAPSPGASLPLALPFQSPEKTGSSSFWIWRKPITGAPFPMNSAGCF